MVYLIGGGPGDPGLITVKGRDILTKAEVVLYDHLVDISLLSMTPDSCRLIDVGKSAGKHTKTQDETTALLVELGSQYDTVVRLKGGDPFLFGRGGEEAEALRDAGIKFEVIPGISALSAVPAYAGIPLTHRDFASSVGVATGHGARGKDDDPVRWRSLATSVDTIVIFMGIGTLKHTIAELIAGGLDPETPAALIEQGTRQTQRVVTAPVRDLDAAAKRKKICPPALLVIGKTVSLNDRLDWFEPGPLAGLCIGVTRPYPQSHSFAEKLHSLGATPIIMPTIAIEYAGNSPESQKAIETLDTFDTIVFFSANGVKSFFQALYNNDFDTRSLGGCRVAAIGPATADTLAHFGVIADIVAESFIAEGLLDSLISSGDVSGRRFLLVRSDRGRDVVPNGLREAGADVCDTVFYRTLPHRLNEHILNMIAEGYIDLVTFTSSSTVDGFFDSVRGLEMKKAPRFASIGPQTSGQIARHSADVSIEASAYTTDGLIAAILDACVKE